MSLLQVIGWLRDFAQAYTPLVVLITTVLGIFGLKIAFWPRIWAKIKEFLNTDIRTLKNENVDLVATLDRVRGAFDDDNNLWLRGPINKPARYDALLRQSIPILVVANLKGGVGKTTIAAYLASYFERRKGERILAIDLDHQGSLSSMLLPEGVQRVQRPAKAIKALIGGTANADNGFLWQRVCVRHSRRDSWLIECDDSFANFETRLVLEWLIGDRKDDIRYNLARFLHSQEVQHNFNRVIIDAPPRMTAGLINALCASTHVVVPFVLDNLSAERVGLFLRTLNRMRDLFPHLELAGVVGTLKGDNTDRLRDTEERAIHEAERGVANNWRPGEYVLRNALIPRKQAIADAAGIGIDPGVSNVFDALGQRLFELTRRHIAVDRESSISQAALWQGQRENLHESQLAARHTQRL